VVRDREADGEGVKQIGRKGEREKERERVRNDVDRARRGIAMEGCDGALAQRVPTNRPIGCPGLRPLSLLEQFLCLARDTTWGKGIGRGWKALLYLRGVIEAIQQY